VTKCLDWGFARWPGIAKLFSSDRLRKWFYYDARAGTAGQFRPLASGRQIVIAVGDAARAGKSQEAVRSAFDAALLSRE
jgi:hypothetical protein